MKITYVDVELLQENVRNPKPHTDKQVGHIANSIERFGWTQPIVVDENNTILIGHGRKKAAEVAGTGKVPVLQLTNLTEDQKLALMLVDNTTNQETGLDPVTVDQILAQLVNSGIELEQFGLVMETLGSETEREQDKNTLKEAYDKYLNGDTKRLVLYFSSDEHKLISARIDRLMQTEKHASKGDLLMAMLKKYLEGETAQ